ncbi:MAG: FkbM family methyltransferase [Chryseolinea sp.]
MINTILGYLHRSRYYKIVCLFCQMGYLLKGHGWVSVRYRREFRAYEFRVDGDIYLSNGPGWAYTFQNLADILRRGFTHFYQPKAGDCVIDIGSGLGEEVAVYAPSVTSTGSVYALEANPYSFAGLKYLCEKNNYSWVRPVQLAVFNVDGEVTIDDDPDNYLKNTINTGDGAVKKYTVKALTIDSFIRQQGISRIDFLKCNIEGAEQFMIEGMSDAIQIIDNMCISCHDFRHTYNNESSFYITKQKVIDFLDNNGYRILLRKTNDVVVSDYVYASRR